MIRNRFPRFRNLQNLHVIPTATNTVLSSQSKPAVSQSPNITILPHNSSTAIDIPKTNIEKKMFSQYKPRGRFNRSRKNRNKRKKQPKFFPPSEVEIHNSSYDWYNHNYLDQPMYSHPPPEKSEEIPEESIPDTPIEEDFEEVEVASVDADGKQEILVGFRASKLQYLNYKRNCFFKPKFYSFGSHRTLVNCLNVQDNCSVDIDIVSEAEYEMDESDNLDQGDSLDQQISKTEQINEEMINSSQHSEGTQEDKPMENGDVKEINTSNDPLINTSKDVDKLYQRIYKTCIDEDPDIKQGHCLIQSSLDSWESHLIGLEYLIEIQYKNKAKYLCVLCSEEIQVEEIPDMNVINHINGCKHIIRYLEKHFPSYGFKFDGNSDYGIVALQKICEEINEKMGYFSMCITNLDCFDKNEQKIINIVLNASHISEKCLKLEKSAYLKELDCDTLKTVQDVVEGIVEKILVSEENAMVSKCVLVEGSILENDISHKVAPSELQSDSLNKSDKITMQKKSISKNNLKSPKLFVKGKGNSNFSSYLKEKYTKAKSRGLKPLKGLLNVTKILSAEIVDSSEKSGHEALRLNKPEEVMSDSISSDTSKRVLGNKEKMFQKPTVHSKHCRKRILGREITRLKVSAKGSTKDDFTSSAFKKSKEKNMSVLEFENQSSSKKIHQSIKSSETVNIPSNTSKPVQKIALVPIQKASKQDSKSSFTRYSKNPNKVICKKGTDSSAHEKDKIRISSSHWKGITRSPVKSPVDNSYVSKNETRKQSGSPVLTSPIKRIVKRLPISPLKLVHRRPIRKFSRSPSKRHSRSPFRRNSRSPYKKLSKSPLRRKSRSPYLKHSRSPLRKKSRSPVRKHSRSPPGRHSRSPLRRYSRGSLWRHSRSPLRHYSRSPKRRYSRSPLRRCSRSPIRRYSRSPVRRSSRSPIRRHSRSPIRRHSRSPVRRHSRSPVRRHSRSPVRRHSRSPVRRHSRSPIRRHSRSPIRRHSRSPIRRHSRSPIRKHSVSVSISPPKEFRNVYKVMSPKIGPSGSSHDHIISDERFSQKMYNYDDHLGKLDREYRSSKNFHSPSNRAPDKHKSHTFVSSTVQGTSDLDPVSDEDESIYFDKQRVEDCITSPSSKKMLSQFLQKFSVSNVNPDDPSLNKLMLFMEAHRAEIQELMGSQSTSKAGKSNATKVDPSVQERNLFLQQYLLSNLAGSAQEPGLSSLNLNKKTKYQQPPFLSETDNAGCGLAHTVASHNHPQANIPRFFPPNVNVPPPDPYRPFNHLPHQEFSPKSQVPPEVMFKDLKATVSKLFGANESATKSEKKKPVVPEYVTEPDPEKWDLNHPDTLKFNAPAKFSGHIGPRFNAPINQKNVFPSQGNSINFNSASESSVMRSDMPIAFNSNNSGQFFSNRGGVDRSQGPNVTVPPPDAKVSFCDVPRSSSKGNLFPVVHNNANSSFSPSSAHGSISDIKVSLAQRLASVLVKIGMTDVPAPLLQEMLMKIGAFSSLPRQDISEAEIISILKRLGYLF